MSETEVFKRETDKKQRDCISIWEAGEMVLRQKREGEMYVSGNLREDICQR